MIGMCSMVRAHARGRDRLTVRMSVGLRVRPYRCKEGWRFYPAVPLTRDSWIIAVACVYRWVSRGRGRRRVRSLDPHTPCVVIRSEDEQSFMLVCRDRTGARVNPKQIDRLDVQFGECQL